MKKNRWTEGHYDFNFLGKVFFFVCLSLLIMIFVVFFKDYNSEWRFYQKNFRKMEVVSTHKSLKSKEGELQNSQDYLNAKKQFKSVSESLKKSQNLINSLKDRLKQAEDRSAKSLSSYQYLKAKYDSLKYQLGAVQSSYTRGNLTQLNRSVKKLAKEKVFLKKNFEKNKKKEEALVKKLELLYADFQKKKKTLSSLLSERDILEKKLKKLDSKVMDFPNKLGSFVRDLPILDMLNPYYKIDQIVIKDMKEDLNFAKVPIVDRCVSCHKGILKKGYEDQPNPYKTHPRLDVYLSSDSPHPIEKFACTVCHKGSGRATSFQAASHTPNSPEQQKEWEHKYHWHKRHHWDKPMLPLRHIQASCYQCHSQETDLKHAEKLNLGLKIIEQSRCYACHKMDRFKDHHVPPAPNLTHMKSKLTDGAWLYHWIHSPKSFRKNTQMPSYFQLSNNSDPHSLERGKQEVLAIKKYIFQKADTYSMEKIPTKGNPLKGKELVSSLGCYACHRIEARFDDADLTMNTLYREHGPQLSYLGSKTNAQWLYNWLKNPKKYHPHTLMPDMRLSNQEAVDITAFLIEKTDRSLSKKSIPSPDKTILDEITADFMKQKKSIEDTQKTIKGMSTEEKLLYTGEKLVTRYGCHSCHQINGVKSFPIGAELNKIGDKPLHQMDFGFLSIPHTKHDWLFHKIKNPRIFDKGKVLDPLDVSIMPRYNLTDQQIDAVVTALLGMVKTDASLRTFPQKPHQSYLHEGQNLMSQLNCRSCHIIGGEGGAIRPTVEDWLKNFEKKTPQESKALSRSYSPPNLIGEGRKVHSEWLFGFLHKPSTIRPWLKVRMPSYSLNKSQLNTLVSYFSHSDDTGEAFSIPDNFDPKLFQAGKILASADYFHCGNCHIQGDQFPKGEPDRWAPDFSLSKKRLKPQWIVNWLYDPQKLLPGTKMPTYFDEEYFDMSGPDNILGGDEHKQIVALTEYVIHSDRAHPSDSSKNLVHTQKTETNGTSEKE